MLLKSTQAYAHDVFKMKIYAEKIQDQFNRLNIEYKDPPSMMNNVAKSRALTFKKHQYKTLIRQATQQPSFIVFKQNVNVTHRNKKKQKITTNWETSISQHT